MFVWVFLLLKFKCRDVYRCSLSRNLTHDDIKCLTLSRTFALIVFLERCYTGAEMCFLGYLAFMKTFFPFLADQKAHPAVTRPFCRRVLRVTFITWFQPIYKRFTALLCVSGALIMASFCSPLPAKAYGQIGGLHLHRSGSKEFLQLLPSGEAAINTMVLCHRNETMLEELKVNQC